MKVLYALLVTSLLALPAAAAAQDVKTDFDKSYNFSNVKTYSIKIGTAWGNDLSERRVLAEFDEALSSKVWKKAPEASADVLVLLHGATTTKKSASTFYTGMGGYGYGYRGWGGGMGMGTSQTVVSEYAVGTLVLDMFDGKSKNLVFARYLADKAENISASLINR